MRTIRSAYSGTKTALVKVPHRKLKNFIESDRIRIGYVEARVRSVPRLIRCYRCHVIGHVSYVCPTNIGAREICRKCGSTDHNIKNCESDPNCMVCTRNILPTDRCGHVAASTQCPRYKECLIEYYEGQM